MVQTMECDSNYKTLAKYGDEYNNYYGDKRKEKNNVGVPSKIIIY